MAGQSTCKARGKKKSSQSFREAPPLAYSFSPGNPTYNFDRTLSMEEETDLTP